MLNGYPRGYTATRGTDGTVRSIASQGLGLLVTVLLARNQQPPPTVAAGVPHAELAAELITLPSGLLAMICEAIVKLKVRLGAAGARASRMVGTYEECWEYFLKCRSGYSSGFRCGSSPLAS